MKPSFSSFFLIRQTPIRMTIKGLNCSSDSRTRIFGSNSFRVQIIPKEISYGGLQTEIPPRYVHKRLWKSRSWRIYLVKNRPFLNALFTSSFFFVTGVFIFCDVRAQLNFSLIVYAGDGTTGGWVYDSLWRVRQSTLEYLIIHSVLGRTLQRLY